MRARAGTGVLFSIWVWGGEFTAAVSEFAPPWRRGLEGAECAPPALEAGPLGVGVGGRSRGLHRELNAKVQVYF